VSQYLNSQINELVEQNAPLTGQTKYFDVLTAAGSNFASLVIQQSGLHDDNHSIVWFNGTTWLKASNVVYQNGTAKVTITDDTSPSLSELTGTVFAAGTLPAERLAGDDRFGTAAAVSQERFPEKDSADAVVLARSDEYPDALAGAPLAAARNAPILLTKSGFLRADVLTEIDRVLEVGDTVYVLGGQGAISKAVADDLRDAGYSVERLAGDNRYETAVAIAEELGHPDVVIEVPGTDFADAVSAGPAASKLDAAILLTRGTKQATATAEYLAAHPDAKRYAVGGRSAKADTDAEAVHGSDRYETSTAVATRFFEAPTLVNVATGLAFADALTAGPMADAPTVLVPGTRTELPEDVESYFETADSSVLRLDVLGGPGAVSQALADTSALLLQ
jgi:putative cell wall-binding protein